MKARFQIRLTELLLWIALFGAGLAHFQVHFAILAAFVTGILLLGAIAKLYPDEIVWGYVFGVVAFVVVSLGVAYYCGESPFIRTKGTPDHVGEFARTYAFTFGGLLGMTIAMVLGRVPPRSALPPAA